MKERDTGYSKKEVAKLLHIAESTVYLYAQQGKIKALPNPFKILPEARYDKLSVDQFMKEQKLDTITGISVPSFAKQLNITPGKIYKLIHMHNLEVELVPRGETRKQYFLPEQTQIQLKELIDGQEFKKGLRSDFYWHAKDIALFQAFESENRSLLRVTRKDSKSWGFYLTTGEWIDFEEAAYRYKLRPLYSIHQKTERNIGKAHFVIPKDYKNLYECIDAVYKTWGIENCTINLREDQLYLSLKSGKWKAVNPVPYVPIELYLGYHLSVGNLEYKDGFYYVDGDMKRTTIDLSKNTYDDLLKYAVTYGRDLREVIEESIKEKLNREGF
ncbi:helix-turn-helix domain-containing protein [Psychrobacillus sp. FSL K6-2684]|uniref:helix-turn-helix domain-containing protein n=1 Tax=unclassified Psychrobacillus TaxID=2636677 RepID=UPI0030FA45FE